MAAAKITQIWTVFITALIKCLAVLGSKATPVAATGAPAPAPAPVAPVASVPALTALLPRQRPGDRSVPPTMKQRIRAEAHGSSPASRSRILSGRDRRDREAAPTGPNPADAAPADLCLV